MLFFYRQNVKTECVLYNVTQLELKYDPSAFKSVTNQILFEPFCFNRKSHKFLPETVQESEEDFNITTKTFDRLGAPYYDYRVGVMAPNNNVNLGHGNSQPYFEVIFRKMVELTAFLVSPRIYWNHYTKTAQFFIRRSYHDQWLPVRDKEGNIIVMLQLVEKQIKL